MKTESSVHKLKRNLKLQGTASGAGATEAFISAFEKRHAVIMPEDLRTYFSDLNGTAGDYAYGLIRFWGLEEVRSIREEIAAKSECEAVIQSKYSDAVENSDSYFVFADFMHEAQLYAIYLSSRDVLNQVILLDGESPTVVADSFSDFLERYIAAPEDLRLNID